VDHYTSLVFDHLQRLLRERCKSVERRCIKHNFRVLLEDRVQTIFHRGAKVNKVDTADFGFEDTPGF
jgi:hypothetical protein